MEELFVDKGSIVRRIWGGSDTVLLIFAGASAEFALNKAVDWLYFTGRLPADPIGRLFSTVRYAQAIVFAERGRAFAAIDQITAIHRGVEAARGLEVGSSAKIPDEAYLDVLFMLIDYSVRSFELLERRLSAAERGEVFDVFYRVGLRMGLRGLPRNFPDWEAMRAEYMAENLVCSRFTTDLYKRYRTSLGFVRYRVLLYGQALLVPVRVRQLLRLRGRRLMYPAVWLYKGARLLGLEGLIKAILLPGAYRTQVADLERAGG